MALANQVLDFVDDINMTILKKAAASAPEIVKKANILTAEAREKLSSEEFALVVNTKEAQTLKKYPVSDAGNTWLSCQYFEETHEALPYVAQKIAASNLNRACAIFNLKPTESVEKLASSDILSNRYSELTSSKDMAKIATIPVTPTDSKHFYALGEHYPMPSGDYVKKAANYFEDHVREFLDASDRHEFAKNVLARADELDTDLSDAQTLNKYASTQYGDSVGSQLSVRMTLVDDTMKAALSKLASLRSETKPETFAKALYMFDKKAGLTKHYDGYITDAFKATFGNFNKVAGYNWSDDKLGISVSGKDLHTVMDKKYEKVAGYFGESVAKELRKHPVEIFESLPSDAKEVIAKIANGQL